MPAAHWKALDQMRSLAKTSTYLAELVRQKWHEQLRANPALVESLRQSDPKMLLGFVPAAKPASAGPTQKKAPSRKRPNVLAQPPAVNERAA